MASPIDRKTFATNNLDLIRLLAASQVALGHAIESINISQYVLLEYLIWFIKFFPGVPLFFFTSGFLISRSFENNPVKKEYALNRVLRLYPALLVSVVITYLLIIYSGYLTQTNASFFDHIKLILAKSTIVQFYNPDFLRAYGDGVFNGNLWTITVEIQFYVLVPLLYILSTKWLNKPLTHPWILGSLFGIFLLLNRAYLSLDPEEITTKLFRVSFIPWLYMFLAGVFFQRYFVQLHRLVAGRFLPLIIVYIITGHFCVEQLNFDLGNNINPLLFVFMCFVVLSGAYSNPNLANRLLKRNDISYGVYIYHIPIANYLMYTNSMSHEVQAIVGLIITYIIAILSWRYLEKPCMKLKKHPLVSA